MTLRLKQRVLREETRSGTYIEDRTYPSPSQIRSEWGWTYRDRQVTLSEGHAWPKDRGVRDAGGDFDTIKLTFKSDAESRTYYTGVHHDAIGSDYYTGDVSCSVSQPGPAQFRTVYENPMDYFSFVPSSSEEKLMAIGSEFVASALPTNPTASASVAIAEFYREGIPRMVGSTVLRDKTSFFRSLGGEYLNLEFGWKPLVNDVRQAAKAIIDSDAILKQLVRDSGRDVHRRRYSQKMRWSEIAWDANVPAASGLPGWIFASPNRHQQIHSYERRNWFSGCFTYHYDPGHMSEVERIVTQARLLYGIELTPETLWNLAPWSWLVDWVTNVGPVLHNLSAFQNDGLVMRYGYVMEENLRDVRYINDRGDIPFGTDLPPRVVERFRGIRKLRRKATPFGFGLDAAGFSTRQWAILAALGITRVPRTL